MKICELKQYSEKNENESKFLLNAFNSDDVILFWSNTKRKYKDVSSLLNMLSSQLSSYILFIGYKSDKPVSFYIAHSISSNNKRAEVLAYVSPHMRDNYYTFTWWIMFLKQLKAKNINNIYAKIFENNSKSLNAAYDAGFELCGVLPRYVSTDERELDVKIFYRNVDFNHLESYWHTKVLSI